MYISDQLIYLELPKTGGSHILKLLEMSVPGEKRAKHQRLPPDFVVGNRLIIGSMRNPWDWYVSLWVYGVSGKGSLRRRLTSRSYRLGHVLRREAGQVLSEISSVSRLPIKQWQQVYRADESHAFRAWLSLLLNPARQADIGEGFAASTVRDIAGLMTYRYLRLYSQNIRALRDGPIFQTVAELEAFDATYNMLHAVIRNERLEADFIQALARAGITLSPAQRQQIVATTPTNVTRRSRRLDEYYDQSSIDLISQREALIINKYGYQPPCCVV